MRFEDLSHASPDCIYRLTLLATADAEQARRAKLRQTTAQLLRRADER